MRSVYLRSVSALEPLQPVVLTAVRVFWGWQFVLTGWGKLGNLHGVTQYFTELGIPMPAIQAVVAASTEFGGGLLLALGLFGRAAAAPLAFTMCVAYATADRDALMQIWSNPDAFVSAAPFQFLLACVMVLAWGPGPWSVDAWLVRRGILPKA